MNVPGPPKPSIGGTNGREPVAMMVLTTAMLTLSATRTAPEPEEERQKRPTIVLTQTGMIVRDANGLRTCLSRSAVKVATAAARIRSTAGGVAALCDQNRRNRTARIIDRV